MMLSMSQDRFRESSGSITTSTVREYFLRGSAMEEAGHLHGAVESYKAAINADTKFYPAYTSLGSLFAALTDWTTASIFFEAAVTLAPHVPDLHNNLGNVLLAQQKCPDAISCYSKAIELSPSDATYHSHLGNALRIQGRFSDAEACFLKALALEPGYAEAYVNLGFVLFEQNKWDNVEECYRRAIALKPNLALAHFNLGTMLLRRGDLLSGWQELEWRWKWKDFSSPTRHFRQPQWQGERIEGAVLLLHAEQGFGDTIQMLRYIPRLAEIGARVLLEVHPELKCLAQDIPGVWRLIARGELIPHFDLHCPLMSLPLAFSTTTLEVIPAPVPYLRSCRPTPEWIRTSRSSHLQVGLVWAGSPKSAIDSRRSVLLSDLTPLAHIEGVEIHSLQRGAPGAAPLVSSAWPFVSELPESADFNETAAAISVLDLVITVDTAVAHLAGALGKPVWILLPQIADWRWLMDREDSPWYPTVRLFRQTSAGDWTAIVAKVATELTAITSPQVRRSHCCVAAFGSGSALKSTEQQQEPPAAVAALGSQG